MTFPQTSSLVSTNEGEEYWRLITQIEGPGDIWESEVGARALMIGPQSDISRVLVTYLDGQEPDSVNSVEVSVRRPFVGRINANMAERFPPGILPGRLLVSLGDQTPNPNFGLSLSGTLFLVQPQIDFLQYLSQEPEFPGARSDKTWRFCISQEVDGAAAIFAVPYYGRRLGSASFRLGSSIATPVSQTLYGVNLGICGAADAQPNHQVVQLEQTTITATGPLTGCSQLRTIERPYDYLAFQFLSNSDFVSVDVTITVSDNVG